MGPSAGNTDHQGLSSRKSLTSEPSPCPVRHTEAPRSFPSPDQAPAPALKEPPLTKPPGLGQFRPAPLCPALRAPLLPIRPSTSHHSWSGCLGTKGSAYLAQGPFQGETPVLPGISWDSVQKRAGSHSVSEVTVSIAEVLVHIWSFL